MAGKEFVRELRTHRNTLKDKIREKAQESVKAVLPVMVIVLILSFLIAPLSPDIMVEFMTGAVLVIIGMAFFSLGAEVSMTPMGERVGGNLVKTKKLWFIIGTGFVLGMMITISEPDLQVLARQVPSVPNMVLILSVALGVGLFLAIALIRILVGFALAPLLILFYLLIFLLAMLAPADFLAVAFDSGGVTTGPMTVPFIMALGVGISAIRNDRHAEDDSFGLVALCSIGPILAVLILSLVYQTEGSFSPEIGRNIATSVEVGQLFFEATPDYMKEIAVSLLPITVFFGLFQMFSLKLEKKTLSKILIGLVYTYIGLVLFLTGANVGFIPAGTLNTLANILVSFTCAMQVEGFRKMDGKPFATTMCTGNLRSGTDNLFQYLKTKDKQKLGNAMQYYGIILCFIGGAAVGAFVTELLETKAVFVALTGLVIALCILRSDDDKLAEGK